MSRPGRLGAWVEGGRVHFRVWAPKANRVEVVADGDPAAVVPLLGDEAGYFAGSSAHVGVGGRYKYRLDGGDSWPDPASRSQPEGVHGPSEVVDPSRFAWTDADWRGPDRDRMVVYELHVGTFTREGTYAGVVEHLAELKDLGVTVVELLPLNACDGWWGWGYDGAALFAPWHAYGRPDDLRALIDRAHALGLGVILDVVYNHFGPAGNYTGQFSDGYHRQDVRTAWGPAINLGGPGSEHVRAFFLANARHWVEEYHFDGFRVDATHAFVDDGPEPFLAEFAREVRACTDRPLILIAEDHRNLNTIITPVEAGGWDFDGVWADDFHHVIRRYLTGDRDGVFQDFAGTVAELATTIDRGWLKTGEWSEYRRKHRGTDPAGIPPERFIFCLQNHDRVGNRGRGDRLHHAVDAATNRAATAALLLAPETPMLFQGQEWAASTPFFYFTDHAPELGQAIRDGRAREFRLYDDFNTPEKLAAIPDPQDQSTFRRSVLDWAERDREPHASALRWHKALLQLRSEAIAADSSDREDSGPGGTIAIRVHPGDAIFISLGEDFAIVNLRGAVSFTHYMQENYEPIILLSSEDPEFTAESDPVTVELLPTKARHFRPWAFRLSRPGAVVVRHQVVKNPDQFRTRPETQP